MPMATSWPRRYSPCAVSAIPERWVEKRRRCSLGGPPPGRRLPTRTVFSYATASRAPPLRRDTNTRSSTMALSPLNPTSLGLSLPLTRSLSRSLDLDAGVSCAAPRSGRRPPRTPKRGLKHGCFTPRPHSVRVTNMSAALWMTNLPQIEHVPPTYVWQARPRYTPSTLCCSTPCQD